MVEQVLDKLSFVLLTPIQRARLDGGSIEVIKKDGSVEVRRMGTIRIEVDTLIEKRIDSRSVRTELQSKDIPGSQYLKLFRFALQAPDMVTEFMFLYAILLTIFDKQGEVDRFIRSIEPDVPYTPRPDKPRIKETIYTRLRNEVAHPNRPKVDLTKTREEISKVLPKFIFIVKKAIERTS
ncbi:MAG: hypothetical protein DRN92_05945 [Thermoproteota archaeon]|nr:MAG: hypothetical protein DRN92_05945 [Candidatus Korarchaeota archaeon]